MWKYIYKPTIKMSPAEYRNLICENGNRDWKNRVGYTFLHYWKYHFKKAEQLGDNII